MRLRLKLAGEGLPSRGQIGWEQFDKQDFTRTKFEQGIDKLGQYKVNYQEQSTP